MALKPGVRAGLTVYVIAVAARIFLLMRVGHDIEACCLAPDSPEYLALSEGSLFNFSRTPGYPVFLWLSRNLFGPSLTATLWVQVFLTSLTPALTALLAAVALPRYAAAAYVAGVLSAVSFTGLTLSRFILSEAVFVPLVTAALLTAWVSARTARVSLMILSAVFGGLAFLVKPVFIIWSAVLPILLWLFGEQRPALRTLALVTVVSLAFPIGWSFVNRFQYGIFAPSSIGAKAGCITLAARTLAIASRPSGPTQQDVRDARSRLIEGASDLESESAIYEYYSTCTTQAILEHPFSAWRAYRANAVEAMPRPFDARELRYSPGIPALESGIVRFPLSRLTDLIYLLAFVGALRLIADGRARLILGLSLFFVALLVPSALVYSVGGRYLYPVESVLWLVAAVAVVPRSSRDSVTTSILAHECGARRGVRLLSVVVPVQTGTAAVDLVHKLRKAKLLDSTDLELVLVDDASGEGQARALEGLATEDPRITLLRHSDASGRAKAFRTGISHSTGDLVVLQRADPAYEPDDYANLIVPIVDGQADVVYGTRWSGYTHRVGSFWHRALQRGLALITNVVHNCDLSDLETGQKVFRGELIRGFQLDAERQDIDVEVTAKSLRSGARLFEVPIRYAQDRQVESRPTLADLVATFLNIVHHRFDGAIDSARHRFVLRLESRAYLKHVRKADKIANRVASHHE
jgi:glycosyltransferase involved in cell wall biosynthesis